MDYLKPQKLQLEFISYVLCKKVGSIIERVNRSFNDGELKPLKEPLDTELLATTSKSILKGLESKLIQIKKASTVMLCTTYLSYFSSDRVLKNEHTIPLRKSLKETIKTYIVCLFLIPQKGFIYGL